MESSVAAEQYDLIVLGAGSGGLATAFRAARHGATVALLEPNRLGGTCVNVGCVPKKAMWLAAELADAQQLACEVGFTTAPGAFDWSAFVGLRQRYIEGIHASYRDRIASHRIELVAAAGRFVDPHRIAADGRELQAPHVLIATGARPRRPDLPGSELGIDSDGFFALDRRPDNVAVVGGSYIAVELAGVLHALGARVRLFVRARQLLRGFDQELAGALCDAMSARGIEPTFGCAPLSASRSGERYALRFGERDAVGGFDTLIWATGRSPNSAGFGLEEIGVECDAAGNVVTDEWQDTGVEGVHALGDVTGRMALTPVAIAAGRQLADRLFGGRADAKLDYGNVPTVVFSHPPFATVGLSEADASAQHGDAVSIHRARFRPMLLALAGREERSLMKLVCVGAEQRIVGIHILGPGADEMLQGFAVALKMGATKADLEATVAIHPTSAEELVLMS
ncbi:MAG TPA: glutathione-disulfide reductase [Rhodanobacteraceae bacterium]|nr:glutathione-disulfide reductase [Rhodanobacteraceae bacterium]